MVTKLDRQLCHVFVSFFGLDRAQRSIVFLSFWTCWSRGDHFSHFVRSQWHIDDSSGVGRCYLVLSRKALDNINLNQMSHRYVSDVLQNDFPQALYILRNLEKFENSIKIHFFIREITANFNNFQGNSTSAQKLLLTWYCTCIYQLPKAFTLRKNVSQNNFCNSFGRSLFAPWWCAVLAVEITPNFKGKKSILV